MLMLLAVVLRSLKTCAFQRLDDVLTRLSSDRRDDKPRMALRPLPVAMQNGASCAGSPVRSDQMQPQSPFTTVCHASMRGQMRQS
ncbi:hypothetical protein [Klebsiella pneumoniae]|uniref:hypothetical protein n=1 Tax=Klebsiella pneumoniae TaxID=573 RepID=UPI0022B673DC|nr:hypothetical protein [Klebsiella pneumoniae]